MRVKNVVMFIAILINMFVLGVSVTTYDWGMFFIAGSSAFLCLYQIDL